MLDIEKIESVISKIPFVTKTYDFNTETLVLNGKVEIMFDGLKEPLNFDIQIYPQYPLKHHESESITFYNKELVKYNHVMENGSICIHTSHNIDLKRKLIIDFNSLKVWIEKYYLNDSKDLNYEHIVVPEQAINDIYYSYVFTEVDYIFSKDEYGEVTLYDLNTAVYKSKNIKNYIVGSFSASGGKTIKCKWSKAYQDYKKPSFGFYYFIEDHPGQYNCFIFKDWTEFDNILSTEFLNKLHKFDKEYSKKYKGALFPIFIGYKTVNNEIHWQVAMLEIGNFPMIGVPEKKEQKKTGKWNSELIDSPINWALTRDSSYRYFFGRGTLCEKIVNSKILIIGIGAIGSMIAKTLTRGGCRYIDIADYDVKEPENVCRSEYMFHFGLGDKVYELQQILTTISPFVDVQIINNEYFESMIKTFHNDKEAKESIVTSLNNYDFIIDCTTDNDLMYILDSLDLDIDMLNISITNHAQELVCAFSPNIYHFVNTQFGTIIKQDTEDLYEPVGCWSPTFKASYNDIDLLVQIAIKQINNVYKIERPKNNFIVTIDEDSTLGLNVKEY